MQLQPNVGSDRSWVWKVAADYSEGEPTSETLAIRFANSESTSFLWVSSQSSSYHHLQTHKHSRRSSRKPSQPTQIRQLHLLHPPRPMPPRTRRSRMKHQRKTRKKMMTAKRKPRMSKMRPAKQCPPPRQSPLTPSQTPPMLQLLPQRRRTKIKLIRSSSSRTMPVCIVHPKHMSRNTSAYLPPNNAFPAILASSSAQALQNSAPSPRDQYRAFPPCLTASSLINTCLTPYFGSNKKSKIAVGLKNNGD
jgi:hypothetical protein